MADRCITPLFKRQLSKIFIIQLTNTGSLILQIIPTLRRILIFLLLSSFLGVGLAFYNNISKSNWTEDGIRGLKDGCNLMGQSSDFCECYTNEVTSRISMKDFFELTKNMTKNKTAAEKAKKNIDPIIAHCSKM